MKTIETVYNKLNNAKTELATHKVELGLIDDFEDEFNKSMQLQSKAMASTTVIDNAARKALKLYDDAGIEKGLQDGASLGGAAIGGIKKSFEALGDIGALAGTALNLNNEAASLIAANVAAKAKSIGAPAAGAIRSVTGVQLNPNTRALFKSVPLRSFAFTFTMVPSSAVEAQIVKGIVRHFREELYPMGLDMAGINYGYKFPNRFIIETKYNEQTIPGLKFLPAYLTGVSSTYNTQGMGFHSDGNFTSTAITLQFTESKALMKQHIQADY